MESPKLREKRDEYELSSTINNIEQSIILQNPFHTLNEIDNNNKQKIKSNLKDRQLRTESNASFLSYVNNKRRTSTILMKPISPSKHHHHHKEKRKFVFDDEKRLIPIQFIPHSHHQIQIQEMRRELTHALQNIRYIAAHCAHESLIESIRDEWKFIATVIDRLQFVIFLTVTIVGTLGLLYEVYDLIFNLIFLIENFSCLGTLFISIWFT
jgi:hypothetical protein